MCWGMERGWAYGAAVATAARPRTVAKNWESILYVVSDMYGYLYQIIYVTERMDKEWSVVK